MTDTPRVPFLERRSYRRRRLIDLLRAVPVFGAVLFAIPLFWSERVSTATAIIYLFAVWAGLVALAFVLAIALGRTEEAVPPERE